MIGSTPAILDPARTRLRPWEVVAVHPGLCGGAALALAAVAALLAGLPPAWPVSTAVGYWCILGILRVAEGDGQRKHRREKIIVSRYRRWRGRRVLAEAVGDAVYVWVYENGRKLGRERFTAGTDDEACHAWLASLESEEKQDATPDARALAAAIRS